MDSSYANAVAILRRIFENEIRAVKQQLEREAEVELGRKEDTKVSP